MSDGVRNLAGVPVWLLADHGPALATPEDAVDLIGAAGAVQARLIVVPVARLAPAFFELANRMAGEFLQKLVNYGQRLAVVGDIESLEARSRALRDFVRESNRGSQVWFVRDHAELERRLGGS